MGRYPAPTKLQEAKPKRLSSGIVNLAGFMYSSDLRKVEALLNKLGDCVAGVDGVEYLVRFEPRQSDDFDGYAISPSVRPW